MNRRQLSYIIALEEAGSASIAAKKLGVSQSTLSKHLSGLEQELGVPIFVRNKNKLDATAYGRVYIDAARRILQLYHFAEQNIHTLSGTKKTDLFLGLPDSEDHRLLLYILTQFETYFPHITLHIRHGTQKELLALLDQYADSTVLTNLVSAPDAAFLSIPILDDQLWFAIAATNPLLTGITKPEDPGCLDPDCFAGCAFILPAADSPVRTIADSLFSARRFTPQITCEVESAAARLELVRQGLGCTFVTATQMTDHSGLVYLRLPQHYAVKKMVVSKNSKAPLPLITWFTEIMKQYYLS